MTDNYKVKIKWTCPHCGKRHTWRWDARYLDLTDAPEHMECECGVETRCRVYQIRLRAVAD